MMRSAFHVPTGTANTARWTYGSGQFKNRKLMKIASAWQSSVNMMERFDGHRDGRPLHVPLSGCTDAGRRWTSYPLSMTGWLRPRHALASQDEGIEFVAMKE